MRENASEQNKEDTPPKKEYAKPELKRYVAPKLRKHTSYKEITRIILNPVAPPPVS